MVIRVIGHVWNDTAECCQHNHGTDKTKTNVDFFIYDICYLK
jgi:hypothetical protein